MSDSYIPNETKKRNNVEKTWMEVCSETEDFSTDEESRLIKKYEQIKDPVGKYPRAVYFIIGNEFCERFCFYGMRAVLTIYLIEVLFYNPDTATVIFHVFSMLAYFMPLFGAFIADSFLGKFRSIFYISIIYLIGNIVISVGAIPHTLNSMVALSLFGLFLIAVGTGGIKPCVSAFGGDQFEPGQERYLQRFFSFFYLTINLGSLLSTAITPIIRTEIHCFGQDTCFPLAFGVPAILMGLSLIIFLMGKPMYIMRPLTGNVVCKVLTCIQHAISNRIHTKDTKKRDHWLDYADDTYDKKFIEDIKVVFHVLFLYLPLPIFWALFDQQASRWTLQAIKLTGSLFGYTIKPDQMQVCNPLLVIILIPLFEYVIYPLCNKCNILTKPLQRITFGGFLAAAAFVLAGFLQLKIESAAQVLPGPGLSETLIINNSPCKLNVNGSVIQPQSNINWENIAIGSQSMVKIDGCPGADAKVHNFTASYPIQLLVIGLSGKELQVFQVEDMRTKHKKGLGQIRILYNTKKPMQSNGTSYFKFHSNVGHKDIFSSSPKAVSVGITDYEGLEPGQYTVSLYDSESNKSLTVGNHEFESGGNYIIAVNQNPDNESNFNFRVINTVKANTLHMFLQVPQYLIITTGEVMFSITGLEFSYSQAPTSMKSVLQAAWLLTIAAGNLIVVIIAEAHFIEKQSIEFFFFATLMGLDMLIFAVMAYYYKYVDNRTTSSESVQPVEKGATIQKTSSAEDTHL